MAEDSRESVVNRSVECILAQMVLPPGDDLQAWNKYESMYQAAQHSLRTKDLELRRARNASLPVMRLPAEVLGIIWARRFGPNSEDGLELPISQVCSRWRSLALDMPTLWTYIRLFVCGHGRDCLNRRHKGTSPIQRVGQAKAFLLRSRAAPLRVYAHLTDLIGVNEPMDSLTGSYEAAWDIRALLQPHTARIKTLEILGRPGDANLLFKRSDIFTNLQHFVASCGQDDDNLNVTGLELLHAELSNLRSLHLMETIWPGELGDGPIQLPSLRELRTVVLHATSIWSIAESCPNLTFLDITCVEQPDASNARELKPPNIPSLRICGICCHYLEDYFKRVHCKDWREVDIRWERWAPWPQPHVSWWGSTEHIPMVSFAPFFAEVQPTSLVFEYDAWAELIRDRWTLAARSGDGHARTIGWPNKVLDGIDDFLLELQHHSWFTELRDIQLPWGVRDVLVDGRVIFPTLKSLVLMTAYEDCSQVEPGTTDVVLPSTRAPQSTTPSLTMLSINARPYPGTILAISPSAVLQFVQLLVGGQQALVLHVGATAIQEDPEDNVTIADLRTTLSTLGCIVEFLTP